MCWREEFLEGGEEHFTLDRLRDESCGPKLLGLGSRSRVILRGDHDHGNAAQLLDALEPLEDKKSLRFRQSKVEENGFWEMGTGQVYRLVSICRPHRSERLLAEDGVEQCPAIGVIINDENRVVHGGRLSRSSAAVCIYRTYASITQVIRTF